MNQTPATEQKFMDTAVRRIGRVILVLVLPGAAVAGWYGGAAVAGGFALGGGLAYLNYRWIVSIVDTLVSAGSAQVPAHAYAKLLLPLGLLAALLYVILSRSLLPVSGIFAGLFLLVVGVLVEAVYEVALAGRR